MPIDPASVVEDVKRSRKYRHLCDATVRRVAASAGSRADSHKGAVKSTKRKLHQIYGAYLEGWDPQAARKLVEGLTPHAGAEAVRAVSRQVLALHASTRERLPLLDTLYRRLFEITGVPRRVLDLGCGLHPFSVPWMGLPQDAQYRAWEIDERMTDLVNLFLSRIGCRGAAFCRDMLAGTPTEQADVVFVLKMLPCLERQEGGCSSRLLRDLNARFVVVSFPTRSIGGRDKGMQAHYSAAMDRILAGLRWPASKVECRQEMFFVLDKR